MKLVEQSAELIKQEAGYEGLLKHIERCGRVCYKSEDRITEDSAKKFFDSILQNKHLSVLEHGEVVMLMDKNVYKNHINSPHARVEECLESEEAYSMATNMRVLVESMTDREVEMVMGLLPYPLAVVLPKHHRVTFHVITSRAILDELLRHRTLSASVESTRFCNYTKEKYGNELTFVAPTDFVKWNSSHQYVFEQTLKDVEYAYFQQIYQGQKPQQARNLLPLSIKSEAYLTAFVDDWIDILRKRITPAAHPDAQALCMSIRDQLIKGGCCTYDDFTKLDI